MVLGREGNAGAAIILMENINIVEENYIKEEIIINIILANIFGIIVLIIALIIFGIPYFLFWHENILNINTNIRNNSSNNFNIYWEYIIVFLGYNIYGCRMW